MTMTSAFGTVPPLESVTMPWRLAPTVWAPAEHGTQQARTPMATRTLVRTAAPVMVMIASDGCDACGGKTIPYDRHFSSGKCGRLKDRPPGPAKAGHYRRFRTA